LRGDLTEGANWLDRVLGLAESGPVPPSLFARTLNVAGLVAQYQGNLGRALAFCQRGVRLLRETDDRPGLAEGLQALANATMRGGQFEAAQALFQESLTLCREQGDDWGVAHALVYAGLIAFMQGDFAGARPSIEAGLALQRSVGDPQAIAQATQALGWTLISLDQLPAALALFRESVSVCEACRDRAGLARAAYALGEIARRQGEYAEARARLDEAASRLVAYGDKYHLTACLSIMASVALDTGQPRRGVQLASASMGIMGRTSAMPAYFRRHYEQTLAALRARLDSGQFEAAWGEGQALLARGLSGEWEWLLAAPEPEPTPASEALREGLTERELDVLRLLAQGLTNAQIAERLVVSTLDHQLV
jgi:ATP/maltotriose-dependent transcriptional regulator MalT